MRMAVAVCLRIHKKSFSTQENQGTLNSTLVTESIVVNVDGNSSYRVLVVRRRNDFDLLRNASVVVSNLCDFVDCHVVVCNFVDYHVVDFLGKNFDSKRAQI